MREREERAQSRETFATRVALCINLSFERITWPSPSRSSWDRRREVHRFSIYDFEVTTMTGFVIDFFVRETLILAKSDIIFTANERLLNTTRGCNSSPM